MGPNFAAERIIKVNQSNIANESKFSNFSHHWFNVNAEKVDILDAMYCPLLG
jgi:hypothetical protein